MRKLNKIQSLKESNNKDFKKDFVRYFAFYFAIILGLMLIAYLLSILPSLLKSNSQKINQDELLSDYCNFYLTKDSIKYNLTYSIVKNGVEIGSINYYFLNSDKGIIKREISKLDMTRIKEYYVMNNNSNISIPSDIFTKIETVYNKNYICNSSYYTVVIDGESYNYTGECSYPDIPFRVCKENLKELSKEEIKVGEINFNSTKYEYTVKFSIGTADFDQKLLIWFSDLPFPIKISDNAGMELVLQNYYKINN